MIDSFLFTEFRRRTLALLAVACLAAGFTVVRPAEATGGEAAHYDVVVVGAGLGGLSAAVTLAKAGLDVLVLEQHHKVGGCATSFKRGDYLFEASIHEITGGGNVDSELSKILKDLGVHQKLNWIKVPDFYRSIGPGVDFTVPQGWDASREAFIERWPDEREGIEAFYDLCMKVHEDMRSLSGMHLKSGLGRTLTLLAAPFRQTSFILNYRRTLQELLDKYFESEELKMVISQLWVYYGPPPTELWAPEFMVANVSYLLEGAWNMEGGSQSLSNAFAERILELGGTIHTGERVTKIDVVDNRAVAVESEFGARYTCDYVVSNANPYATFFEMIGEEYFPPKFVDKFKSYKPANSLFGVYMGLDVTPEELGFSDYEVFYNGSLDPVENYENMMGGRYDKAACTITCYTNLGDTSYNDEGKAVVVLHSYADIDNWPAERDAYLARKEDAAGQLITLAENVIPGLADHIVVQEVITPRSLQAYTLNHRGSPYGLFMSPDQAQILGDHATPIENLFVANNATGIRHGISTAQMNGYRAAQVVLAREGQ